MKSTRKISELFNRGCGSRLRISLQSGQCEAGPRLLSIPCTRVNCWKNKDNGSSTFSTVSTKFLGATNANSSMLYWPARLDPHFTGRSNRPFREIDSFTGTRPGLYAPNFAMVWGIYKTVRERRRKSPPRCHDGDSVVSHGYKYLDELAVQGAGGP